MLLFDHGYGQVWQVMQYVKEQHPQLWGRHQGRDHFLWMAGDLGACHLLDDPLVQVRRYSHD